MIRALWFFALALLAAVGAAYLADVPGEVRLRIGATEITTSVLVAALLLAGVLIGALVSYRLILFLLDAPGAIQRWRGRRRAASGQLAIARGLVAVAAGDVREARQHVARARALVPASPLTLLLEAQAAQLAGDEQGVERHYKAMLAAPETEFLAIRGLFMQALRREDRGAALAQAKRAFALRPKTPWVVTALFDLQSQDKNWPGAAEALSAQVKARLIDDSLARRRRAVLLAAEALDLDRANATEAALAKAQAALQLSPGLFPAAQIAARTLAAQGRGWKAADTIEAAWVQAPHPDLAALYAALKPGESPEARAKRMQGLAALNPTHPESRLLVAGERLALRDVAGARAAVSPLLSPVPTARVCALMADIELAEHGEGARPSEWLARSVRAPRDAYWFCSACGKPSLQWQTVCGTCQAFDTLEWKAPAEPLLQRLSGGAEAAEAELARLLYRAPGLEAAAGGLRGEAPSRPQPPAIVPAPPLAPAQPPFLEPMRAPDDPGPDALDEDYPAPPRRPAQGGTSW